jgi:hypothetical protein
VFEALLPLQRLGKSCVATATILIRYWLSESLYVAELWRGRVDAVLAALLIPAFAVYASYKTVTHPGSLRRLAERLGNERERDKKRARRLVQARIVAVLILSLTCTAPLVYFGEWPQVWESLEISGSLLDLSA